MELVINRQTLEAERLVGKAQAQKLVRAEALVSGAGREEVEILLADAGILTGKTDAQTDRVSVDGKVKCQAVYRIGGESVVRALSVEAPVNQTVEIHGAQAGMHARARSVVDEVKAKYENGHMVFDVSVTSDVMAVELKPTEVICGVSGENSVETRFEEVTSRKVSAENAVTALISDNVTLPAQLDARTALMEWASVTDVDARRDLGGIRVTGNVQCEALISSGVAARPVALVRYAMPLNQMVPMPEWLPDDVRAAVAVRSVTSQVEQAPGGEDGSLRLEVEAEVSVMAVGTDRAQALTDAYSTGAEAVSAVVKNVEVCTGMETVSVREPFRGTIMMPSGGGTVSSVCSAHARATVGEIASEGGRTTVSGVVDAQALYMSGGDEKLLSAAAELPFEATLATEIEEGDWVRVNVLSADGAALMSDRIEFKCLLEIEAEKRRSAVHSVAADLLPSGDNERPRGVLLIWPQEGDTSWSVGKKYHIPVSRVAESRKDEGSLAGSVIVMRA